MRLIDADALKDRVGRMWNNRQLTNTKYKTIIELLDIEPTIELERKKGKFIRTEFYEWECSECGCVFEDGEPTYDFYPNCGVDMRGEEDGR